MKEQLLKWLVEILIAFLSADKLKQLADYLLDFVEEAVIGSKSTVDDAIVLPMCSKIREAFGIADNDPPIP